MTDMEIPILPCLHRDPEQPGKIREKIREVFHCEVPLDDERLVERFSVTATGDLIMKFR